MTISVVVAVLAISGALAMNALSSSTTSTNQMPSTTSMSSITTSTTTTSVTTNTPNHGWVNFTDQLGPNYEPYSPIVFGAEASNNVSNIGPNAWIGHMIFNSPMNASAGIYKTVPIPANTFVWESFRIGPSTYFNDIVVPYAVMNINANVTMVVYVNGNMVVNVSGQGNDFQGFPPNTTSYAGGYHTLTQNYPIPSGSLVTIGFMPLNGQVGLFPLQSVPGNASFVANMRIPSSLSDLPNNATIYPMLLMFGMADPTPMG